MARPKTSHEERKQAVVAAALHVFGAHGYEGTTNKLIAREVSRATGRSFTPALIYHYFPEGKPQLFAAVLQGYQPLQQLAQIVQQGYHEPPEVLLPRLAGYYVTVFRQPETLSFLRIILAEAPRQRELGQVMLERVAPVVLMPLAAYLIHQMQLGTLRPINPVVAIWSFFGPLLARALITSVVSGLPTPLPFPSDEEMVATHVRVYLDGLRMHDGYKER